MNSAFRNLLKRNEELVADNMIKSAEISELKQKLEELHSAIRVVTSQTGHNKCFVWELFLHKQLGDGSPPPQWPDPESAPLEEFLMGCTYYAPTVFAELTGIQSEMMGEIREVIKEYQLKIASSQ